ncbi:MAG: pilus assembly protein TadG-related protein [Sphingomonadales bacterium]
MRKSCAQKIRLLADLIRDRRGAVVTYVAVFIVGGVGAAGLAIDFGRLAVLKAQLQDAADATALAASVQLDGRDGAIGRATSVAMNASSHVSALSSSGTLDVASVNFYSAIGPSPVATAVDGDAAFVEVIMQPVQVNLLFQPVLSLLSAVNENGSLQVAASAMANPKPFICEAPPLMLCDFAEIDPLMDLRLPSNAGRQIRLKEPQNGGGAWAPGNFGLLSLPDGSSGAAAISAALAAVTPADCFDLDVVTATGSKTNKIKDAVNARFDLPGNSWPYPAPNVIDYPRDAELADPNAKLGSGNWDLAGYWAAKHGGATPGALAGASRYQVYLYEQGLEFGRKGKETFYPVTSAMPADFTVVTPPGPNLAAAADPANQNDPAFDGVPSQAVAPNGYARRLMKVAQLQCIADNIHGNGTYPTDGNYVEVFITETVKDPPDAAIFGEVVRGLSSVNSPEFHANVRLVR